MKQPVKILAVGNSFSEDATFYLPQIAEAGGIPMILGRLYIGGCSLETHWENVRSGEEKYLYNHTGREEVTASIEHGMTAEDWDFVTFQQASHFSGLPATYHPFLENLSVYAKRLAPHARQAIHETWAYSQDSPHPYFYLYGNSQEEMYSRLSEAYRQAAEAIHANAFLPVGDSWQLARSSSIGDTLCRDGSHGNEKGRYLGAAVWYECLLGGDIRKNPFCPEEISPEELEILKICAHEAVAAAHSH